MVLFLCYLFWASIMYDLYDGIYPASIMMSNIGKTRGWFVKKGEIPEIIDNDTKTVQMEKRNAVLLHYLMWLTPPKLIAETWSIWHYELSYFKIKYL